MEFGFEQLLVWQNSRELTRMVYKLTAVFPKEERFGLSDQLRRAAVSIASNIAEGSGRFSLKEKIHFCEIAYGSLMEVNCQLILAIDLGFTDVDDVQAIRDKSEEISRQLSAYRRSMFQQYSKL